MFTFFTIASNSTSYLDTVAEKSLDTCEFPWGRNPNNARTSFIRRANFQVLDTLAKKLDIGMSHKSRDMEA